MTPNPSLRACTLGCLGCLAFGLLGACSAPAQSAQEKSPDQARFLLVRQPEDEEAAARLEVLARAAITRVEGFFGAPYSSPFTITIYPDRAAFDVSFPPEWGIAKTECWMVATGVADGVQILSPRVWSAEACEHDATDELHVERLLTHELVHVFHGQHNPSPDFVDVTGIDWFVEGLATLASGQLEDEKLASAREALERNAGPTTLAAAWTGRYRYGVSRLAGRVPGARARARANRPVPGSVVG